MLLKQKPPLSRREFIEISTKALFSGIMLQIIGCNYTGGDNKTPAGALRGEITANHGHVVYVTQNQLKEGIAVNLVFSGTSDHQHQVVLTSADISIIKLGTSQVSKLSTDGGINSHSHTVTWN